MAWIEVDAVTSNNEPLGRCVVDTGKILAVFEKHEGILVAYPGEIFFNMDFDYMKLILQGNLPS